MLPTPINLVFQILFVVKIANISVSDLKQSLANKATSKKNWWFNPVQSKSLGL